VGPGKAALTTGWSLRWTLPCAAKLRFAGSQIDRLHGMKMRLATLATVLLLAIPGLLGAQQPEHIPLTVTSAFSADEVGWVLKPGNATVTGQAFLRLEDGSLKSCAGFNIELLPAGKYANERIQKTYRNNEQGQILLEENPPKFTPDVPAYHEMLLKGACDQRGEFRFEQVPAGEYYVMAFIIWEDTRSDPGRKTGGGVMKRIRVTPGSQVMVRLEN
jgi:hypothetical protein